MGEMDDLSVFDKLVTDLSRSERQDMLERIRSSVSADDEGAPPPDDVVSVDLEAEYQKMGLFRRFVVILRAFFGGRERTAVVEEQLLTQLARRVREAMPDEFHSSRLELLPEFASGLATVAGEAREFGPALSRSLGSERNGFVAFLFGLQLPMVQAELIRATDMDEIIRYEPALSDFAVKKRALAAIEEQLGTIGAKQRQYIYQDVRLLHHLHALASFPFDRMIATFEAEPGGQRQTVALTRLTEDLGRLASVTKGLWRAPSGALLEGLALYERHDSLGQDNAEIMVEERLMALQRSAQGIRRFAGTYPLVDLLRLAHGNINHAVAAISGGEDWFAQLKSFWKDRVETAYRRFAYRRKQQAFLEQAQSLLEVASLSPFPGYPESGPSGATRHAVSTGVLYESFGNMYKEKIAPPLGVVFRDGQFYKADNRKEFDEAYQELDRVQTDLANFASRLRMQGDFGAGLNQLAANDLPEDVAQERRRGIYSAIDTAAESIVSRAIAAFRLLSTILSGILYGEIGGLYDSLSNIADIGGRNNPTVMRQLEVCQATLKSIADTVAELYNLETLSRNG